MAVRITEAGAMRHTQIEGSIFGYSDGYDPPLWRRGLFPAALL